MKCVGEIHILQPGPALRDNRCGIDSHGGEPTKDAQRAGHVRHLVAVGTAQHPFDLEDDGDRQEDQLPSISAQARHGSSGGSPVRYRTTTLVSIASMTPPGLRQNDRVHLNDGFATLRPLRR